MGFPESGFFLEGLRTPYARIKALYRLQILQSDKPHPPYGLRFRLACLLQFFRFWLRKRGMSTIGLFLSRRRTMQEWVKALDEISLSNGFDAWIEKTPRHFYQLDLMRVAAPNIKFVFIVRNGPDVVASIVDRARRFPDWFQGQNIHYATKVWNDAVRVAYQSNADDDVLVVDFEELLRRTDFVLAQLGERLGLCQRDATVLSNVIRPSEGWKAQVKLGPGSPLSKWDSLFSEEEKQEILGQLDLNLYKKLRFIHG